MNTDYKPATWEKLASASVAVAIVALVGFLVIRNEPFADQQLAVLVRILLSLATAILGATVPGFLRVDWSIRGFTVRAAGALALFVVTYFFSPKLAPTLSPTEIPPLKNPRPVSYHHRSDIRNVALSTKVAPDWWPEPALIHQEREQKTTPKQTGKNESPISSSAQHGLQLRAAFQGDSPKDRKIYDFTISNSSDQQRILKNFHVRWVYRSGVLLSVDRGLLLTPIARYWIKIPVDTEYSLQMFGEDVPVSPAILLPPKNSDGPSVTTLRLEMLYELTGRLKYHPNDDWEIFYQVMVNDDTGDSLQLLSRTWRHDNNYDWVEEYCNKKMLATHEAIRACPK